MLKWSRREFISRSALAVLASRSGWLSQSVTFPARTFGLTSVYERPGGIVIGHFAPDSVHQVCQSNGWLLTEQGCIPNTEMQPITLYTKPTPALPKNPPFWAELIAPSSAIRAYASGSAPLIRTLGYGAVVRIIGVLTDDLGQSWYEIESGGWVIGCHFSFLGDDVDLTPQPPLRLQRGRGSDTSGLSDLQLRINLRSLMMRMVTNRHMIIQTPFYGGAGISTQPTILRVVQPGGDLGAPWQMITDSGKRVYGAYWHNRFGLASDEVDLQLPVEMAKMIYALVTTMWCTVSID